MHMHMHMHMHNNNDWNFQNAAADCLRKRRRVVVVDVVAWAPPVRCTRAELSRVALGRLEKEVSNNKSSRGHWGMIDKMSPQKMHVEGAALGGRCIWVSHMWVLHGLVKVASAYSCIRCAQSAAAKRKEKKAKRKARQGRARQGIHEGKAHRHTGE